MRILTIGTFDLLHEGHIDLFNRCRALAGKHGRVFIGVNSDAFVKQYKGALPWVPEHSRRAQVRAYGVDFLHAPADHSFGTANAIDAFMPDYLVIGMDWARRDYVGQLGIDHDWLDEHKIGLIYVPLVPDISSSIVKTHRDFSRSGHND